MRAQADKWRHSTETQARKAKILDRQVAKLQANRTEVIKRERKVKFMLPEPARAGGVVLTRRAAWPSPTGTTRCCTSVDFVVDRGDRVVVIGRNGAGKSSLLRCLAGMQVPTRGTVETGYHVAVGYFAQEHEQIDLDADRARQRGRHRARQGVRTPVPPRLLRAEREHSRPSGPGSLSGGERARLSLAMLSAGQANLLVLDEPTNNLDPAVGRRRSAPCCQPGRAPSSR